MSLAHQPFRSVPTAAIAAVRRYRDADLGQRIAVATPHELVAMLYTGAREALTAACAATRAADAAARVASATRAMSILDALDGALDHGRGGTVARALSAAYAQIRAVTVAANTERSADLFTAAATQLANLGGGWASIIPRSEQRVAV